ncbi:MAG: hypothetical protein DLM70_13015 [Chloroflexi bacterium]|nr:MAG: hypothetical protein DLM70_13015 [Chloroflexota bacterium]
MITRDVFSSDEYVEHFRPDEEHNPFRAIYASKQADVLHAVRNILPGQAQVLDLGGGMGRMAVPLARRYQVTLCDISREMLNLAATRAGKAHVERSFRTCQVDAARRLPFEDETFDCALSIDLVVHLPDPVASLREIHRVLKPDAQLLVDTTNSTPWWALRYPSYVGRRPSRWMRTLRGGGVLPEWQDIVRHYTPAQLRAMLVQSSFSIAEEWSYGPRWCSKWFLTRCVRTED